MPTEQVHQYGEQIPDHADRAKAMTMFLDRVLPQALLDLRYEIVQGAPGSRPELMVEFSGPDLDLVREHRGELLLALEHMAAKTLRLEPEEHDLISFEAGNFKQERDGHLNAAADEARRLIAETGRPYRFPPMSSRERRMLHLALTAAGFQTQSEGEGARRHLVAYPRKVRPATA